VRGATAAVVMMSLNDESPTDAGLVELPRHAVASDVSEHTRLRDAFRSVNPRGTSCCTQCDSRTTTTHTSPLDYDSHTPSVGQCCWPVGNAVSPVEAMPFAPLGNAVRLVAPRRAKRGVGVGRRPSAVGQQPRRRELDPDLPKGDRRTRHGDSTIPARSAGMVEAAGIEPASENEPARDPTGLVQPEISPRS
jgi:hypothetical protein